MHFSDRTSRDVVKAFLLEVRMLSVIRHPHCVTFFGVSNSELQPHP
jgi:hypothetical protein